MPATTPAAPTATVPPAAGREPPAVDRGTVRHDGVRTRRWVVRGIAKIAGDVEVGSADLAGTVVVGGRLSAGELSVRGRLDARGVVEVSGRIRSDGGLDAGASVTAGDAQLDGTIRAGGEIAVGAGLRVRGALRCPSLRADGLHLRGSIAVPGTVAATSVDLRLVGDSAIGLVRATDVLLRGPAPNVVRRVLDREVLVTVERVEAQRVRLEAVRVGSVRAPEVVLGPDAHVASVEGKVVRAHPSSHLGPESWSRPPPGLSR